MSRDEIRAADEDDWRTRQYCVPLGFSVGEHVKTLLIQAEKGVTAAQVEAGSFFYECHEFEKAARWFRLAANNGDTYSQAHLAWMHNRGEGVPVNYELAAEWWKRAAEGGDPKSQYNLGLWLRKGKGLPKSDDQAIYWFRRAAEQGHQKAQSLLESTQKQSESQQPNHGAEE